MGATPRRPPSRGVEIQAWLDDASPRPDAFVILDDVADMAHLAPHAVMTTWEEGLLDAHVDEALLRLGVPALEIADRDATDLPPEQC